MASKSSVSQPYDYSLKTGPHGSGKSTLVRSLGRKGQYSDTRTTSASTSTTARSDKGKGVDYDIQDSADLAINFEYLDLSGGADGADDGTACCQPFHTFDSDRIFLFPALPFDLLLHYYPRLA